MEYTLTVFSYFSPKSAIAPSRFASSSGIISIVTGKSAWICSLTIRSTSAFSSAVIGCGWEKSKRSRSAVIFDPFCCTWSPRTIRNALCSKCVAVWYAVVCSEWSAKPPLKICSLPARESAWCFLKASSNSALSTIKPDSRASSSVSSMGKP